MLNARMLLGLLLAGVGLGGAAQSPQTLWDITTAPQGDGTRAFIDGYGVFGPFTYSVQQPGFDALAVLATPDGAYLVVPTHGGGDSENLSYLLPPSWPINRGWQIVRLSATGDVLWSRLLNTGSYPAAPQAGNLSGYRSQPELLQTQLTSAGGIAVLSSNGLAVLDASGAQTFLSDLRLDLCRPAVEDFAAPSRQFFTAEGLLILGFGLESGAEPRACAISLEGVELDRVTSSAQAMEVGDYRSGVGFLLKEGSWSNGVWSNVSLALRSQTTTHWTRAAADSQGLEPGLAISASGETWLPLGDQFSKIRLDGTIAWQFAPEEIPENIPLAWLPGDRLLLRAGDGTALRALQSDGQSAWTRKTGALGSSPQDVDWQVRSDRVLAYGYDRGSLVGRALALQASDGAVITDTTVHWTPPRRPLAFGPLATDRAIAVSPGPASAVWSNSSGSPCDLQGYCPTAANFARLEFSVHDTADGSVIGTPVVPELGYPLAAHPLEKRSAPRPTSADGKTISGLLSLQYVYDGSRNLAEIRHVSIQGSLLWARTLGFAERDAAQATLYDNGSSVFISAARQGSVASAAPAKLWKLARNDGSLEWEVDLPVVPQQLVAQSSAATGQEICAISVELPHQLVCVSTVSGSVRTLPLTNLPADVRLESAGRLATAQIRVRVLPRSESFSDRFAFASVNGNGLFQPQIDQTFAAIAATQRLRADAFHFGSGVATAALYNNTVGLGRSQSLQVAKFDSNGSRLWQTAIEIPMRSFVEGSETTAIAINSQGDIHVSLHPHDNHISFPTAVCKLTSAGVLIGCVTAAREGRIVSLFSVDEQPGIWVWQRGYLGANTGPMGMYLYRMDELGFGPELRAADRHVAWIADSDLSSDGLGLFMLASNGSGGNRASSDTRLLAIQLTDLPLFADGFE